MMASRGFAYRSEAAAGKQNAFHGNCGCEPVCSWDTSNPRLAGYSPEDLREQYEYMRNYDAARKKEREAGFMEPDVRIGTPTQKADARTYWLNRQSKIPAQFNGQRLEPDEVRFVEKFYMSGNRLEWQEQGVRMEDGIIRPAYDFKWLNHGGIGVEQKTVHDASYKVAERTVWKVLDKALAWPEVIRKRVSMVSYLDAPSADVLDLLASFNSSHDESHQIDQLWLTFGEPIRMERVI